MQIQDVWSEKDLEMFKLIVREYWVNGKSIGWINKKYHIGSRYWMIKFNIPRKDGKGKDWKKLRCDRKHKRMKKIIPKPELCPICKEKKKLDLTNLNHEYNEDINEWVWKCRSCHNKYDYSKGFRFISEEHIKKFSKKIKKYHEENPEKYKGKNNPTYRHDLEYITREYLYKQYWELEKSIQKIAEENNCSKKLIFERMKQFDLSRRSTGRKRLKKK